MRIRGLLYILLFLIFISAPSCKKKAAKDGREDTLTTGFIRVASDETFKIMMDAQITSFEVHHDYQAIVIPIYDNEDEVIRFLIEDSVRLAITTRDMNPTEKSELAERNMHLKKFLIAFDGIALITNRVNQDSLLSIQTVKKILTGEITEWSQINSNTTLGTIRVLFDNKNSSIFRYVVDSIAGRETISSNLYALNNAQEVMEKVIEMPNTIGIVGVSTLSGEAGSEFRNLRNEVRTLRISLEDPPLLENSHLPYAIDIKQERYPFWRPVFALLTDPRAGLSSGFTYFLSHEVGQKIILKSDLLPVTAPHITNMRIIDEFPNENSRSRTIN
jgi:ABC-type phosphate transport system, periplasmic component